MLLILYQLAFASVHYLYMLINIHDNKALE